MRRPLTLLILPLASSLLFLTVFTYIGWKAFQHVFSSDTKAAFAILILVLEGMMILWLRFMCGNFVKCYQYVERLAGIFVALVIILGLFDASVLFMKPQVLTSDFCITLNAILFAVLLILGFLLAWESINITCRWLGSSEEPRVEDKRAVEQKYGKAGYS